MTSFRNERVADLLLAFLAEEVRRMRDPRLELVTITGISVSRDLKFATVYWSSALSVSAEAEQELAADSFPDEQRQKEVGEALKGAENFLKRRIAEELELRSVPKLIFKYDASGATGAKIDTLLKKAGF